MLRKTGIFPAGFIQPFLLVYGLVYIFASIYYINKIKKMKGPKYCESNKILLRWIMLVATVILTFVLLQSIQYLSLLIKGDFSFFAQIGQSLSLISMKVYLLVNPVAVENMNGCMEVVEEIAGFPFMSHDDLVDATTMALMRFRQGGFIRLPSDEPDEQRYFKSKRKGYY